MRITREFDGWFRFEKNWLRSWRRNSVLMHFIFLPPLSVLATPRAFAVHHLGRDFTIHDWGSLPGHETDQFAQRFADRQHAPQFFWGKVRPCAYEASTFAADLHDAHYFFLKRNRRADDFLDRLSRRRRRLHSFKHGGVPYRREIVVDLGPAVSCGSRGQRRIAGERNESHIFRYVRHQKM